MTSTDRLVYRVEIDAPVPDVWRAITDPNWTRRYFYDTAVHTTWAPGSPIAYKTPDGATAIGGTLVEIEPPRRFSMRARLYFDPEAESEAESLITWEIAALNEHRSTLTLIHDQVPPRTLSLVRGGWTPVMVQLHQSLCPGVAAVVHES